MQRDAWTMALITWALCLVACSADDALRSAGEPCSSAELCASTLCYEQVCLDPAADDDGDGLINAVEASEVLGSNPLAVDTDGDGERDDVEVGSAVDAPLDADGDGLADAIESALGDEDQDCIPDEIDPEEAGFSFVACEAEGKSCGVNSCGGSCGTCGEDELCNASGDCIDKICTPSCDGRVCGDDGCGGSCGDCGPGLLCMGDSCRLADSCADATAVAITLYDLAAGPIFLSDSLSDSNSSVDFFLEGDGCDLPDGGAFTGFGGSKLGNGDRTLAITATAQDVGSNAVRRGITATVHSLGTPDYPCATTVGALALNACPTGDPGVAPDMCLAADESTSQPCDGCLGDGQVPCTNDEMHVAQVRVPMVGDAAGDWTNEVVHLVI
ncbi:MAG: hypothetical protein QF464_16420, partial [Myxococcota bacterium]|nr:hypothetical protein [Myxococcota bacterium]